MTPVRPALVRFARLAILVAPVLWAGCSSSSKNPATPEVPVAPKADSPLGALSLLQFSWEQRDTAAYLGLLPGNFTYDFSPSDAVPPGSTLDKAQELAMAGHLFHTGFGSNPAATQITFDLPPALTVTDDDRAGKPAPWHKRVNTNLRLTVVTPSGEYATDGPAVFYFTRGDSAAPAPGMATFATVAGDSTLWFLDTWTDDIVCSPGKKCVTPGSVKITYGGGAVPTRPEP